jgi:WD40 repeat protein/energy-coupling factor transporter ATP-binding protein EcfA2
MTRTDRFNPFPGLRAFEPDEDHLFFGRERQVDNLLSRLRRTRFLSVVGTSGSGKSSLVRSGLIPSLYSGYMVHAGSSWRIALMRPGGDPIRNLAAALDAPGVLRMEQADGMNRGLLEATLRRSALGLVDAIKHAHVPADENVLVAVDQFEELFRFKQGKPGSTVRDEAIAFVKLLLEGARHCEGHIYVVLTMRSEFIGRCTEFPGLAEAVNEGQYLVPRLTRDELRLAITGPVAVGGGTIAPRLVTRVLNDVGDYTDQLPILQHALMRTWSCWERNHGDGPIDFADYEAVGTMTDALSRHAEEAYAELTTQRDQQICESVFKALTETTPQAGGIRRPSTLEELCLIAGATCEQVIGVIDRFRAPGRSFLMPPMSVELDDRTIVDLSHESLMRVWTRLIAWTYEDARSEEIYRRLCEAAALYEDGEGGLLRDPALQMTLNWREAHHPTAAWAQRYDPDFDRAMQFLSGSEKARNAEVAEKERARRLQLERTRRVAIALASLCLLAFGTGIYAVKKRADAERSTQQALHAYELARRMEQDARAAEKVAIEERKNAEQRKSEADAATKTAIEQRQLAQTEAARAETAQARAEREAQEADRQRNLADEQRVEAERRRTEALAAQSAAVAAQREAETQSRRAVDEKTAADKARTEAERLARLALARALAAKAVGQWETSQRPLAALLARQAFLLTKDNGGDPEDANIYSALWTSLSFLTPDRDRSFPLHDDAVRAVQLTPDGTRLITGSDDGRIRLFSASASTAAPTPMIVGALNSPVRAIAIDATGNLVAAGALDGTVHVWDFRRASADPQVLAAHTAATGAVVFDRRGRLISAGFDGAVRIWERGLSGSGRPILEKHPHRIQSLAVSADNATLAAGSDGGGLLLWDLRDLSKPPRPIETDRRVSAIAFRNDSRLVAAGTQEGRITIWDISAGARQPVKSVVVHGAGVTGIAFGRTLVASSSLDGTVKLWRAGTDAAGVDLDRPIVLSDRGGWMRAVALSPDDLRVFAAVDRRVRSWVTRTDVLANEVCSRVSNDITAQQWHQYVSDTLKYERTCPARTASPTPR